MNNIWRPYTQEKTSPLPTTIKEAKGAYYITSDGKRIFDAISSWWVNTHGHSHPYIAEKINAQMKTLQQVIFAGYTHQEGERLASRVLNLFQHHFEKVFFSDNGSTAVEVGIKMALQFWSNSGIKKNRIIAFEGGYHGDTFGARSVTECIKEPTGLSKSMTNVHFITCPLQGDKESQRRSLAEFSELVKKYNDIGAFIFEPMVQGVSGMRVQEAETLNELIRLAHKNNVITIADEVMTGFYRTGKAFAIDHISEKPNIICLAKGLTGGMLPLSLTLCEKKIYEGFYSDDKTKALLHGHSFTGNALGCAVANASLDLFEKRETLESIQNIESSHQRFLEKISKYGNLKTRMLGTILAIEFKTEQETNYFNQLSEKITKYFIQKNMLIRPLGNIIYLLPPYCTTTLDLIPVYEAIEQFIEENQ